MPLVGSLEPGLLVGRGHLADGPVQGQVDHVPLTGRGQLREGRHREDGLELVPLAGVAHLGEDVCLGAGGAEDDPGLAQLAGVLDLLLLVGGDHLVAEICWDKDDLVPLAGALVHVHLSGGLGDGQGEGLVDEGLVPFDLSSVILPSRGLRLQVLGSWGPLVIAGVLVLDPSSWGRDILQNVLIIYGLSDLGANPQWI